MSNFREQATRKLEGIITEGKVNTEAALRGIQQEFEQRRDLMLLPKAIDFQVDGGGVRPVILGEHFDLTGHSEDQLYSRAGIPPAFAKKIISAGEFGLLKNNLETLLPAFSGGGLLVRHVGPKIKGIMSSAFRRVDASPIFEAFVSSCIARGLVPYRGMNTDTRHAVSFLLPEIYEPAKEEFVVYGAQITTSDYGHSALSFNMMVLRIICKNLAVGLNVMRQVHLGKRFDEWGDTDVITLSEKTHQLDAKTVASAISDGVNSFHQFTHALNGNIERAASKEADTEKVMEKMKKKGFKKEITEEIKTLMEANVPVEALPPGNTIWRLSNAISLVANGKEGDSRLDLENEAMSLIAA